MDQATVRQWEPPPVHSVSGGEAADVSFSRAEEDEEQNPSTTEKLAVSCLMYQPDVNFYRVADPLLQISVIDAASAR